MKEVKTIYSEKKKIKKMNNIKTIVKNSQQTEYFLDTEYFLNIKTKNKFKLFILKFLFKVFGVEVSKFKKIEAEKHISIKTYNFYDVQNDILIQINDLEIKGFVATHVLLPYSIYGILQDGLLKERYYVSSFYTEDRLTFCGLKILFSREENEIKVLSLI